MKRKEALRLAIKRIGAALSSAEDGAVGAEKASAGKKLDGQVPAEGSGVGTAAKTEEQAAGLSAIDSQDGAAGVEPGLGERTEEGFQVIGHRSVADRQPVRPVEGASDKLQQPKFIKVGGAPVDEL